MILHGYFVDSTTVEHEISKTIKNDQMDLFEGMWFYVFALSEGYY